MNRLISWTVKLAAGGKREVRVELRQGRIKWQFKHSNDERWDYERAATAAEWDALEDILHRRAGRGRAVELIETARRLREKAGV
jgi:hypothetical protein